MTIEITNILKTQPDKALKLAELYFENAQQQKDIPSMLTSSILILKAHNILGQYKQTEKLAIPFSQLHEKAENSEGLADCWYAIGVAKHGLSQWLESAEYLQKAIDVFKEPDIEKSKLANCYNVMACVNMEIGKFSESYQNFDNCLDLINEELEKPFLCKVIINMGKLQFLLEEFEDAYKNMQKVLRITDEINFPIIRLVALINCGVAKYELKAFEKAEIYLKRALSNAKSGNYQRLSFNTSGLLAQSYIETDKLQQAIELTTRNLEKLKKVPDNKSYLLIVFPHLRCLNLYKRYEEVIELGEAAYELSCQLADSAKQKDILTELLVAHQALNNTSESLAITLKLLVVKELIYKRNNKLKILNAKSEQVIQERESKIDQQARVIQFINESKKQLEEKNRHLEKEIAQRKIAEAKLIDLNNEIASFATVASHDMREPLRTIASYAQLLKRRIKTEEANEELIEFIVDASKRMQVLLSDLISYTKVETAEILFESVDLNSLLSIVISNLNSQITEAKVSLVVAEKLPTIYSSKTLLNLVFQNLISNAVKYRSKEKEPFVHIKYEYQKNGHYFHIEDNGIGIEKQYLDEIFMPFRRLHSKADYEGIGIGLATVKRIVTKKLKGKIFVESAVNKGSKFTIILPDLH